MPGLAKACRKDIRDFCSDATNNDQMIPCLKKNIKVGQIRPRGCLHDPALPGCNEAWDRFDVLKIAITCGTCLNKIVS